MGLEDIGDKVKRRDKEERADNLGLDNIDKLEDIDEIQSRLNNISQAHVTQDMRIEKLEDEIDTLWKVIKVLLEDDSNENETGQHLGMGDGREHKEETGASEGGPSGDSSGSSSGSERDFGWLSDDE